MASRCPYSGLPVLSCKVSDLCDCFDRPELDERAAEIARERPKPDPLDERWFATDSEQWAEVVRLLERAPEPKPRLADLLRERGMFASQQGDATRPIPPESG